ncbi:MAG: SpoIID/LytB domain-containing protein [Caulobacteraceae bacterium]
MKAKKTALAYILIFITAFASLSMNSGTVSADVSVPEIIKIGLSYAGTADNMFTLSSETGMSIAVNEANTYKDLFKISSSSGIKIRKDIYYNIISGKEKEIAYVRAARYDGEVIGPYHIQIGDTYADINSAKQIADQVSSVAPSVFIAYDGGWRVWSQLYLEETECLNQIEVMKNELGDLKYSVVYPDKKRIQILDQATGQLLYIINSENKIKITPEEIQGKTSALQYKGKRYRGSITLQSQKESDVTVVNELPLQEYLYGVVPSEMPASWHMEALKAQAVAARNYTLVTMGRHSANGFDLCATEHCQAYNGMAQENSRSNEAVDATKGKVLIYDGKLAATYFHSSSGGHTENIENVWGSSLPYIRGVDDKYGLGSPNDNWTLQIDRKSIKDKLAQAKIDLGDILDIKPLEISEFGRVTKVEFIGAKDNITFEKEKLRSILGTRSLKSIWYKLKTDADIYITNSLSAPAALGRTSGMSVITAAGTSKVSSPANKVFVKGMTNTASYNINPNMYTFEGKGFGHGLGMSQYGAKGMAEAGYNYIKILEYYYQGAKVQ